MVIALCKLLALLHVVPSPVPFVVTRMMVWAWSVVAKSSDISRVCLIAIVVVALGCEVGVLAVAGAVAVVPIYYCVNN